MHNLRFVTAFKDRHGKVRYRFRRTGFPNFYLPNDPTSEDFKRKYDECLRGEMPEKTPRPVKRQPNARPAKRFKADVVYFIGAASGPVKIGFSGNVRNRLSKLQIGHPYRLRILAYIDGTKESEREYHHLFSDQRIRGEWYQRTPDIIAEIARIRDCKRLTQPTG